MAARFRVVILLCILTTILLTFLLWRLESEISRSRSVDCELIVDSWQAIQTIADTIELPLVVPDASEEVAHVLDVRNRMSEENATRIRDTLGPKPTC
jgi:hypothetical protein